VWYILYTKYTRKTAGFGRKHIDKNDKIRTGFWSGFVIKEKIANPYSAAYGCNDKNCQFIQLFVVANAEFYLMLYKQNSTVYNEDVIFTI
jgi:hypothetical protein